MASRITTCPKCNSTKIVEFNPEERETAPGNICRIYCECSDCKNRFYINSWTRSGKRKGILY